MTVYRDPIFMKQSYFSRLKKHSKALYFTVLVYVIGSVLMIPSRLNPYMIFEMTPIFTWGMFSTAADPSPDKNYIFYDLKYDGKPFNLPTYQDHRKIFFGYTIPNYDNLMSNGYEDPVTPKYASVLQKAGINPAYASHISNEPGLIRTYPQWLKRYMADNLGETINKIEVNKRWVKFNAEGHLVIDSSKVIIHE